MLRFVGQMRTAVFHLRDLRIGIVRVVPVVVVALLVSLAMQSRQLLTGRSVDAGFLRQFLQKIVITLTSIPADDGAQDGKRASRYVSEEVCPRAASLRSAADFASAARCGSAIRRPGTWPCTDFGSAPHQLASGR